jgi:hypothetical protein
MRNCIKSWNVKNTSKAEFIYAGDFFSCFNLLIPFLDCMLSVEKDDFIIRVGLANVISICPAFNLGHFLHILTLFFHISIVRRILNVKHSPMF